jgi:hypothetical protein
MATESSGEEWASYSARKRIRHLETPKIIEHARKWTEIRKKTGEISDLDCRMGIGEGRSQLGTGILGLKFL